MTFPANLGEANGFDFHDLARFLAGGKQGRSLSSDLAEKVLEVSGIITMPLSNAGDSLAWLMRAGGLYDFLDTLHFRPTNKDIYIVGRVAGKPGWRVIGYSHNNSVLCLASARLTDAITYAGNEKE